MPDIVATYCGNKFLLTEICGEVMSKQMAGRMIHIRVGLQMKTKPRETNQTRQVVIIYAAYLVLNK